MKRQVIQTLLNLPGLSAVALVDRRQRPGWIGPQPPLADHWQGSLTQGIQQVVATMPVGFDSFCFRFTNYLVYLHKLETEQVLLLLLANPDLNQGYQLALSQFQAALLDEPDGLDTLPQALADWDGLQAGAGPAIANSSTETCEPGAAAVGAVSPAAIIEALNHVSEGATPYLGNIIVANTWKQSRPKNPWLAQFDVQRDGHFVMVPASVEPLTPEQHQWIRDWVMAFIDRGGRTIRNFQGLVSDRLPPQEKPLLFG